MHGRHGRRYTIALLPGDGVGPELVAEGRRVLDSVTDRFGHRFIYEELLIGGAAIDEVGSPLPAHTVRICRDADAVLLGAVGGPKWDKLSATVRPEQGLLGIRRDLGLFANIRPAKVHPALRSASPLRPERLENVDLVFVRELTGGIYFGEKTLERVPAGELATDVCTYDTGEIERIARVAADLARTRSGRLTSVDKANVLETSRLWRRVTTRVVAEEFPGLALDHMLVDNCAMQLMLNPSRFDVILTDNMFGDILSDEAAVLTGSIGLLPSASLGSESDDKPTRPGLYEPVHGSAPDLTGTNTANPIGMILSVAMLLRHSLSLGEEARAIEDAVSVAITENVRTRDLGGRASMTEVTDRVIDNLLSERSSSGELHPAGRDLASSRDSSRAPQ